MLIRNAANYIKQYTALTVGLSTFIIYRTHNTLLIKYRDVVVIYQNYKLKCVMRCGRAGIVGVAGILTDKYKPPSEWSILSICGYQWHDPTRHNIPYYQYSTKSISIFGFKMTQYKHHAFIVLPQLIWDNLADCLSQI